MASLHEFGFTAGGGSDENDARAGNDDMEHLAGNDDDDGGVYGLPTASQGGRVRRRDVAAIPQLGK